MTVGWCEGEVGAATGNQLQSQTTVASDDKTMPGSDGDIFEKELLDQDVSVAQDP